MEEIFHIDAIAGLIYCHLVVIVLHEHKKLMQQQLCENFTAGLLQLYGSGMWKGCEQN